MIIQTDADSVNKTSNFGTIFIETITNITLTYNCQLN